MVLILAPIIKDVKNIKIIGTMLIVNKNNNFLSFVLILIFVFTFEITNKNIIKKGKRIPICFAKNNKG